MSKTDRAIQTIVLNKIVAERDRQDSKWGDEDLFADPHLWLRILTEEVGEVAKDISRKEGVDAVEEELIQVAAVAVGWLEDIEHEKARIKEHAYKWESLTSTK